MKKIKEFIEKNKDELKNLLVGKKEQARTIRFNISSKQVKNNRELRNVKKDIARILTLINAK